MGTGSLRKLAELGKDSQLVDQKDSVEEFAKLAFLGSKTGGLKALLSNRGGHDAFINFLAAENGAEHLAFKQINALGKADAESLHSETLPDPTRPDPTQLRARTCSRPFTRRTSRSVCCCTNPRA